MLRPSIFLVFLAAGCGRLPDAPILPTDDTAFEPPEAVVPAGIPDDPAAPYRISPGDVVTIRTYSAQNQEYTGLIVDERGVLHVPLAGDIDVGGQSLTEAETRVETGLRAFDRVVRVNLVIEEQTGHMATVLGAVRDPGRVTIVPGMRLADLLASAGGPVVRTSTASAIEVADLGSAQLIRGGSALPVSVELAERGDPRHNVRVRSGDHLYVPASRGSTITVLGEVREPAIVGFRAGMRLSTALALAGGLAPDAHRRDIRVIRGSLAAPRVYRTDLRALVDGNGPDIVLAEGDIVFVTRTRLASLRDVLSALAPLLSAAQNVGLGVGLSRR